MSKLRLGPSAGWTGSTRFSCLGAPAAKSSAPEGRSARATAMLAVGISEDGQREILGPQDGPQRD
jgi:hypothetical protein